MNIAVFSLNLSFFKPLADAFQSRGHRLSYYKETGNQREDGFQMGNLLQWADAYFIEFCQTPLPEIVERNKLFKKPIFARMHRIEVYNSLTNDSKFPWDQIRMLFVSAEHVLDKFMRKRSGLSKPQECVIAKTNRIDTNQFKLDNRKWKYPLRMCMLGNFVPKKRQYSLIENMFDINVMFPNKFKLDLVGQRGLWSGYGNPEYFENCLDLIEDRNLGSIVTVYDPLPPDKVHEFLCDENIIISNSNEEGTHVSIAEGICSGCLAFVHNWRGATSVYPPEVALHFNSTGEFVDLCEKVNDWIELGQIESEVTKRSTEGVKMFGDMGMYDRIVLAIEEAVKGTKVTKDNEKKQDKTTVSSKKEEVGE